MALTCMMARRAKATGKKPHPQRPRLTVHLKGVTGAACAGVMLGWSNGAPPSFAKGEPDSASPCGVTRLCLCDT